MKLSQDDDGRFWRSPRKRQLRVEEPSSVEDAKTTVLNALDLSKREKGETTFSGDHATGLYVYFGHMGDKEAPAFEKWIRWINSNERCLTFCGPMPAGTPRFCKNDRCAFGPGDCPTLITLGRRLGVGVPFCSVDGMTPIPTVQNLAQALKNFYDHTIGRFSVQPPELKLLRDKFDKALKAYEDAVAPIEALRTQIEAEAVLALSLPQIEATISAKVNARGFSRHNALVQIMILQDWGLGKHSMSSIASKIADDEPLNPFFQYVAKRRSSKDSMLPLITKECPDQSSDVPHLRSQWSWERDSAKEEWKDTMYWDCLFIAAMFVETSTAPSDRDSAIEKSLRDALAGAIKLVGQAYAAADAVLNEIADLLKTMPDPVGTARDKAKEYEDAAKNPGKVLDDLKNDPLGTAQRLDPNPIPSPVPTSIPTSIPTPFRRW